ncbi:hypothetical protein, partial [Paramylibacter kogurei]|uniref:hypothetical protein n=1 Tax=Paramylibacter kogurei TaxID=1889778 RepID=UPI00196A83C7
MKNVMNTPQPYLHRLTLLGLTTAIVTAGGLMPIRAQDCALVNGEIPEQCTHANAGHTVAMPTQPNVELEDIPDLGVDGFEISVDGDPVSLDGVVQKQRNTISAKKRRQDIALAQASVAVKFDGLDVRPRLDAHLEQTGNVLRFQNQMNYPAFVRRGEVRIIDTSGRGGAKTVAIIPLKPNAQTSVTRPSGDGLQYVYRVYDARGRFDETAPASLDAPARRGDASDVEQGTDSAALRNIPVFGGAVTVSGRDLRGGANVSTLGETLRADPNGTFVIQRILPTGDHMVDVDVAGGPNLSRDIDVPASDLFYIGLIDVTLGKTLSNDLEDATGDDYDKFYNKGRIAFYLKGKIKGDYLLTAAADTGEDELKNLLRNFDEKDPTSLLDRIDPNEYYPVYGDDSTSEIDAPTSGKFYIKLEKDTSHAMWGNFKSAIEGTEYLRNERTLYGAQGVYNSNAQTNNGDARVSVQLHAAQPETLPQRDSFLGTGGSTYFLKFQDISQGSETILIEVQNSTTGQVIERRTLVYGIDYDINYVQGLVILKSPLSGSAGNSDLIVNNPNGDNNVHLIVNYEHTPTSVDVDSYSYGGRGQFWVNDKLRVGVTAQDEDLGTSEQTAYGVDMLYRHSEQTYAELEYAKTSGVGSGENRSVDGGLTFGDIVGVDGEGRAIRFKGQLDLADINADYDGLIGGYFEDRSAGFSTLNYRTDNDERLWGIHADFAVSERARVRLEYDDYHDSTGKTLREGGATLAFQKTDAVLWEFGVEHVEKNTPTDPDETGERTDIGVRLTYEPNDRYKVYGFAQASLRHEGGLDKNNRVGFGGEVQVNDHWRL